MTYTYSLLPISREAYEEIRTKLEDDKSDETRERN